LSQRAPHILSQIIKGYIHIRESGYIHRDLKPANISLKNSTVKISSFGFAKLASRDSSIKERFNLVNPLYRPPESLRDNTYSEKSDIWSIGIILYEMLTGDIPFTANDQRGLLQELLSINLPPLIR
jgi:serine/threonine protein kinase